MMTFRVAAITAVILGLAVVTAVLIAGTLTRPVDALMTAIKAFQAGDLDAQADARSHDELGTLAAAFNVMGHDLKESIRQRQEQARLRQELELARRIQTALLPDLVKNLRPDFEISATMLPAEEVGGDYYDVLTGRDGALWLAIGDVSGHGVTPGLIMMMAQTIHATLTTQDILTPADALIRVNRMLYANVHDRLNANHFMTFTTLKYEGDGRFTHAGAHLDLIAHRQAAQACELIDTDGVFLNFIPEIAHAAKNNTFTLDVGDTLVLYTDGLTEAQNPRKELLDVPRFLDIVRRHAGKAVDDMRDAIMRDVLAWCENVREDDMTLVIVRRVR